MECFDNIKTANELRRQLRNLILLGKLPSGTKLPGARSLGRHCKLHYQTINTIYHELCEQNFLEIRPGSGSVVRTPDFSNIRLGFFNITEKITERSHMFYAREMLEAAKSQAARYGISLTQIDVESGAANQDRIITKAIDEFDGLIIQEENLNHLGLFLHARIPIIQYMGERDVPLSSINYDRNAAIYMATCHLIATGRRRIALLAGDLALRPVQSKLTGYIRAMRDAGLAIKPDFIWEFKSYKFFQVAQSIEKYLEANELFDGYICCGSSQGTLLLNHMNRNGIKVPEQAAIVAYDEIDNGDNLTRIVLPRRAMAIACVDRLLEHIGQRMPVIHEFVPVELNQSTTGRNESHNPRKQQ